jgi:putative transposase
MPRQARLDAPGTLHHVIVRGIEKRRIVDDDKDRQHFVSRLGECALDAENGIYAWSLQTNHAHILLKSGQKGLSYFMRRFLTGYAVNYNIRHGRHGHLFQNRYKSIVCDEDVYFRELIRYIHLNPLRAGLVKDISDLEVYPWSGHSALTGKMVHSWQECNYVLSLFGRGRREARRKYREYVAEGVPAGMRPELTGGGLIRSMGGWSEVMSLRRSKEKALCDERILGSGEFVENLLREADEHVKYRLSGEARREKGKNMIRDFCEKNGVHLEELRAGSRRAGIPQIRTELALKLVQECGLSLAEIGRQLGVTTSAVSKALRRGKGGNST